MVVILVGGMSQRHMHPDEVMPMVMGFYFIFMFLIVVISLIVDKKLSGLDAVKASIKAGSANAGGILGLLLLNFGLVLLGVLACYVGAFLTMPISMASYAVAYRKVFGESPASPVPPPPPASWAA